MVGAIRLIAQYWVWLALVFVLLAVLFWRQSMLARRDARFSIFGLEKEQAQRRKASSRGRALLMLLLAAGLYGLSRYAVPLLPAAGGDAEPTGASGQQPTVTATMTPSMAIQFLRRTETAASLLPAATSSGGPSATPTAGTPTPAGTPEATAAPAPVPAAACGNAGVRITSPGSGSAVSGVVTVAGTADISGFQFYKLEVAAGEQPSGWSVMGDVRYTSVQAGVLGTWDTSSLPAGTYWLRLVVVDQTGNYPSPCAVAVRVAN